MIILALDTALNACSVALVEDERVLASCSEPMVRGHQERLALMVQEVMAKADLPFAALDRIAVTVGPGSFTGLRVGLAFAKGLALALDRPCIGIGSLQALAASAGSEGLVCAVIDARRDQLYLQVFIDGHPVMAPDALSAEMATARLGELWQGGSVTLVGPGAAALSGLFAKTILMECAAADPVAIARLARHAPPIAPKPLYLRAPDAKLPGGITPPGLEP
jgi:tRNA threonylcarbamoyladenosine biosynthesis protein TsaB